MSHDARRLVLIGGGGHAAVVAEAALAAGWQVLGYLDDARESGPPGLTHLGTVADLRLALGVREDVDAVHAAVGDASTRETWLDLAQRPAPPVIHPTATVSPSAEIADGVFIGARAVIQARARLGRGVIVNTGAIVEHDCEIGRFAHIAPGAVLAGAVLVGMQSLVGLNATVNPGVEIGSGATVGAGAVVVSDVPADETVVGVPARPSPSRLPDTP